MNLPLSDRLEPLGIVAGGFLILVAIGTVAGTPWQTNNDTLVSAVQIAGAVITAVVGAALIWLSRQTD